MKIKYLPSVSWFVLASVQQQLIVSSAEEYKKEIHPNRCSIASANGIINLNVPLAGGRNQKTKMGELKIAEVSWKRNHLNAIKSAYGKASFFLFYFDEFEKIIVNADDNYFNLCIDLLKWLQKELIPSAALIISDENRLYEEKELLVEKKYHQVFENKFGFQNNVSAIDLLFCLGPDGKKYLSVTRNSISKLPD